MVKKNLKLIVVRLGNEYLNPYTTKELKITIGEI